jgi:phage tail sheath protein FI
MATDTTYPGVYVSESSTSVGTVIPVSTATAAFVGYTRRGPLNQPVRIGSFADYERYFGGANRHGAVGQAARQFFANGGSTAVIVRVIKDGSADAAAVTLTAHDHHDDHGPGRPRAARAEPEPENADTRDDRDREQPVLEIHAKEPGYWGNSLHVQVDYATRDPRETFNLHVVDGTGRGRESFHDLSMDSDDDRYAPAVLNAESRLIRAEAVGRGRPDPSGTVSREFERELPDLDADIRVRIGDEEREFRLWREHHDGRPPKHLSELAALLERKLRAQPDCPGSNAFGGARVRTAGRRLVTTAGSLDEGDVVHFEGEHCDRLGLEEFAHPPALGLSGGDDGDPPEPGDLIGDGSTKTGLQALRDVDDVNLLNLPDLAAWESIEDTATVLSAADRLCRENRTFLLIDAPAGWTSVDAARTGIELLDAVRSDHAALYFPHLVVADPHGPPCPVPPGGAVAGVIARTDATRGVWRAPAGTEARLTGVRALTVPLTDRENGLLNPLGVNCLRAFPGTGPVVWGARTLDDGAWTYVPVRRLALHLEESLYRALRWVVFEPNTEQLWSAIRLEVGAYLDTLFRRGAFAGRTPREAFFVRCDAATTTDADVAAGVVNVVVGFAPVDPAEFVIVEIQQLAGQAEYR